ncbi:MULTISPECIES: helix-turn-helix domain-containing protein [Bacillaceae]|uniref:Helix-turn-helix transcriptional regulator n=1 Tax=Priestia flexa TaxID=86664 RepID=A0ABU4J258_9BACI|nr:MULTISPECIES: helix-turn-helix transcriptional regulator [Bacillaceae]MDW8515080.1 helix-turn-helix transcriptional regulator [Priestia flexa]
MKIRNNLRVLMAQHKMNIQDVSDATGLSRKSISKMYNETAVQVQLEVLVKLCALFNCGVEDILILEKSDSQESE